MAEKKRVLAFDFGASGGRAMAGSFDGSRIVFEEIHRFSNDPVSVNGTLYWDVLRLFYEIKQGIIKARNSGGFDSIGIDTWGVDFGLIDKKGNLIENPVHYRDGRTASLMEECFTLIPRSEFYEVTGTQFMEINTVFQLYALKKYRPELLERADTFLLMPDLFNFMLTGQKRTEYSIASTTQLLDAKEKTWSQDILRRLGLPQRIFTDIVYPGAIAGNLCLSLCEELSVPSVPVVCVASHDTQSAVAAVPAQTKDFVFISCGTWSLFGTELKEPIITAKSSAYNLTNEGGCGGAVTFMKNIVGLWLIQESRRQWQREGYEYSFAELEKTARNSDPFICLIDPDAPEFTPQGNMPQRIREYAKRTGQTEPETPGAIIRCIYESLALKYRCAFEEICGCTGIDYPVIHIAGGGSRDSLLCSMTASSCGKPVIAGPAEATVLGNIAVQLVALGGISSIAAARKITAGDGKDTVRYEPEKNAEWETQLERFRKLL